MMYFCCIIYDGWPGGADGPGGNPSPGTLYQTNRCFTPESFCLPSFSNSSLFPLRNIYVGERVHRAGFLSVCVFIWN